MDGWTLSNLWISCLIASELLKNGWKCERVFIFGTFSSKNHGHKTENIAPTTAISDRKKEKNTGHASDLLRVPHRHNKLDTEKSADTGGRHQFALYIRYVLYFDIYTLNGYTSCIRLEPNLTTLPPEIHKLSKISACSDTTTNVDLCQTIIRTSIDLQKLII